MGGKNAVAYTFGEQWRVIDKINEKIFKSSVFTTIPALQQFTTSTCEAIERCVAVLSCYLCLATWLDLFQLMCTKQRPTNVHKASFHYTSTRLDFTCVLVLGVTQTEGDMCL